MIIQLSHIGNEYRATLKGSLPFEGRGKTQAEAVGYLIIMLATADDAENATEGIDVRLLS